MKNLASILCDGGEKKDYRRNIYLIKGRMICDKNDITPQSDNYPRGEEGINQALNDIEAMYSAGCWELEFNTFSTTLRKLKGEKMSIKTWSDPTQDQINEALKYQSEERLKIIDHLIEFPETCRNCWTLFIIAK